MHPAQIVMGEVECWLGLMATETYARAADVANVRAKTLPSGDDAVTTGGGRVSGGGRRPA